MSLFSFPPHLHIPGSAGYQFFATKFFKRILATYLTVMPQFPSVEKVAAASTESHRLIEELVAPYAEADVAP